MQIVYSYRIFEKINDCELYVPGPGTDRERPASVPTHRQSFRGESEEMDLEEVRSDHELHVSVSPRNPRNFDAASSYHSDDAKPCNRTLVTPAAEKKSREAVRTLLVVEKPSKRSHGKRRTKPYLRRSTPTGHDQPAAAAVGRWATTRTPTTFW